MVLVRQNPYLVGQIFSTVKHLRFLSLLLLAFGAHAQQDSVLIEISKFQDELNKEFRDPKTSPLKGKALKRFKHHDFFPVDLQYRVEAILTVTSDATFFKMMTSQAPADYRMYGWLKFDLRGKTFEVPVFQSKKLMATEAYKNYLFFPFTDETCGTLTYSGGRYIGLYIPVSGNKIIIDFNQAYNPYCAYSDGYACPLVPLTNRLDVEVLAGVKYTDK
jgi:uncharacterized protein